MKRLLAPSSRDSVNRNLLVLAAITLLLLPFWLPIRDLLILRIIHTSWYPPIQNALVLDELHSIVALLTLIGLPLHAPWHTLFFKAPSGNTDALSFFGNCFLFFLTTFTGLGGKHTLFSKSLTVLLGVSAMYLFAILRCLCILLLPFGVLHPFAFVIRDYVSVFLLYSWIACFWWCAYRFILKPPYRFPTLVVAENQPKKEG